ncbi:hypothetical protein [Gordonia sp. (in: high G+C Gram-positive bacteria)]|uniref:8-oxoguanine DNA glycosylase OGG fold protein n=1 Tax=Gordonia sp. (in: high G+C Gram-positive bacteria) TaxID=84139 RepID=UPI0035272B39
MRPTDLSNLAPPTSMKPWLSTADPTSEINGQGFDVNVGWWRDALRSARLDPDLVNHEHITRQHLFSMAADAAVDPIAAERLLWNSVAWGLGSRKRLARKRIASFAADRDTTANLLVDAAVLSKSDPAAAYRLLMPHRPRIKYLGPAFLTKYLYFAGAGEPAHPSLILDSRVATSLHSAGWKSLSCKGGWPSSTYQRYCELVERWSATCAAPRRDLVERYLFDRSASAADQVR